MLTLNIQVSHIELDRWKSWNVEIGELYSSNHSNEIFIFLFVPLAFAFFCGGGHNLKVL